MIHVPSDSGSTVVKVIFAALFIVALGGFLHATFRLWSLKFGAGGRAFDLEVAWPIWKKFAPSLGAARREWLKMARERYCWRKVLFTDEWIEEHLA
jgi:hypothetical protein